MTSSRDSLIPDTKPRSEAEARIEKALKVALDALETGPRTEFISQNNTEAAYSLYRASLAKIIAILDGGKS